MAQNEAVQRLKKILARRAGIIPDAARFEALLRDYFPDEHGEREVLMGALREGIPGRLRGDAEAPRAVLRANLEGLLRNRRHTDAKAAAWAVAVWAAALDIDFPTRNRDQNGGGKSPAGNTTVIGENRKPVEARRNVGEQQKKNAQKWIPR